MMEGKGKEEAFPIDYRKCLLNHRPMLEKAGLWWYITRFRDPIKYKEEIVHSWVNTVAEDPKHFTVRNAEYQLLVQSPLSYCTFQLPDEKTCTTLDRLNEPSKFEWQNIFLEGKEGNYDVQTDRWEFSKAQEPWNSLFSFTNKCFCFQQFPTELPMTTIRMAVAALKGIKVNWSAFLLSHLHRSLLEMKAGANGEASMKSVITRIWETSMRNDFVTPFTVMTQVDDPKPKEPGPIGANIQTYLKRTNVGTSLVQVGPTEAQTDPISPWKKTRVEIQSALVDQEGEIQFEAVEESILVQQIVAGVTKKIAGDGVLDKKLLELQAALRNSCAVTNEVVASNAKLALQLKDQGEQIQLLEQRVRSQDGKLIGKSAELNRMEKELRERDGVLKGQKEQIECLSMDIAKKTRLLAEKDKQLELELIAQVGQISQLRARDAEEASKQQQEALSALQSQLMDTQAQLEKARLPSTSTSHMVEIAPEDIGRLDRIKAQVWKWEKTLPSLQSLFATYESQRDLYLMLEELQATQIITLGSLQRLWAEAEGMGNQPLIAEMLVRGDLEMVDLVAALPLLGDLEAQSLQYYSTLEAELQCRRLVKSNSKDRISVLDRYAPAVQNALSTMSWAQLRQWEATLDAQAAFLSNEALLKATLSNSMNRQHSSQMEEITADSYKQSFASTLSRIYQMVGPLKANRRPLSYELQSTLQVDGRVCEVRPELTDSLQVIPRVANETYLGSYDALFDHLAEPPFISWKAIEWMLQDYGMARQWETAPDKMMRLQSAKNPKWTVLPPPVVARDPCFCLCERRYRWAPEATINSVEYNWPRIPGPFYTPEDCASSYNRFFEQHRHHHDPVCFRAAIFSAILAQWCWVMRVSIDVNIYAHGNKEFWLFMRLQYSSSRFTRLLEAMAISNFIAGVHPSLADEGPNLDKACQRFLLVQARHNYRTLKADAHLFYCLPQAQEWEKKRNESQTASRQRR